MITKKSIEKGEALKDNKSMIKTLSNNSLILRSNWHYDKRKLMPGISP